jgi:hypothetical protein
MFEEQLMGIAWKYEWNKNAIVVHDPAPPQGGWQLHRSHIMAVC